MTYDFFWDPIKVIYTFFLIIFIIHILFHFFLYRLWLKELKIVQVFVLDAELLKKFLSRDIEF